MPQRHQENMVVSFEARRLGCWDAQNEFDLRQDLHDLQDFFCFKGIIILFILLILSKYFQVLVFLGVLCVLAVQYCFLSAFACPAVDLSLL